MSKITKVTSNIKSVDGSAWTHELGQLNLLVGPNESGKSAIAEAIQLAVSGSAYGLFFRNAQVKTGAQLVDLGPVGGGEIFAEVEFEDGSTSRWEMLPGKRPKQTGQAAVALPVSELRDVLSGSPQKARKFFSQHLLSPVGRGELEQRLQNPGHDLTIPLENILPDDGNSISGEALAAAPSSAGSWKRKAQAEAKAASSLLTTFTNAEKVERSDVYDVWEQLFKALRFEWARKQFKAAEDPKEKEFLKNLALSLGTKEELKGLEGSAQYSEKIEVLLTQDALYTAAGRARATVEQAQKSVEEYGDLEKALDVAIFKLLKEPMKAYTKRVNKFLPRGDKFQIIHEEKTFKVCLKRGGQTHVALSGSAEARTLAAMGAGLAKEGEASILILDDRMWDTSNLVKTMEKLEGSSCQVILMTTVSPRGRKRSAWNYVEVSRQVCEDEAEEEVNPLPVAEPNEESEDAFPW